VPSLRLLKQSIKDKQSSWHEVYTDKNADTMILPQPFEDCSNMHKLVIFKILRPVAMLRVFKAFIVEELGEEFIRSPPFDIEKSFKESNNLISKKT